MSSYESTIRIHWEELNLEVNEICENLNREPPLIIAVSKTRTIEDVTAAYDIGIRDFGENYAQEFEEKAKEMPNANWHFIGHLQRGNVKRVVPYVNTLHTLDSERLTNKIVSSGFNGKCLIQIKISDEISKHGLINNYNEINNLKKHASENGLNIIGLMAIGGISWDDEKLKSEYIKVDMMKERLGLEELSIGMSADYKVAIEAGSTMIRIGTRIFGERI